MRLLVFLMILSGCAGTTAVRGPAGKPAKGEPAVPPPPPTIKISSDRDTNPFAKVYAPSSDAPKVVGGYSSGCLFGGMQMPKSGPGYEMVRMSRNRYYGHHSLIAVLLRGGEELREQATMLYGDLAQPRGGPMPGGHVSHQSGLDADIWFHKFSPKEKMTEHDRENLYGASVLRSDRLDIDEKKWDETYTAQLMWFAGQPETERIFVNAAIKRRLCKQFPGDPRLARLRPWFFHDDHFHLRIKCPAGEASCVGQETAKDIECEEKDLAYWFTPEVIAKFTEKSEKKPYETNLPFECKKLIP